MPRKPLPGPSRLSQILRHLQQEPIPTLPALSSLRLTYAIRNDHFGARHFVKEDLPRIAFANPSLKIVVDKLDKKIEDKLIPVMDVEFHNGAQYKIDMDKKWSSTILTELLELHTKRGANIKLSVATGRNEQRQPKGNADSNRPLSGSRRTSSHRKHAV